MKMRRLEGIEVEAVINDYISREFVQDLSPLPLANGTPLLETGILDSLSVLRLVVFIKNQFGITVDVADLTTENFDTVDAICACLRSLSTERASYAASRG